MRTFILMLLPMRFEDQEIRKRLPKAARSTCRSLAERITPPHASKGGPTLNRVTLARGPDTRKSMAEFSGVHGAERACGSACQTAWLNQKCLRKPPKGTTLLMIKLNTQFGERALIYRRKCGPQLQCLLLVGLLYLSIKVMIIDSVRAVERCLMRHLVTVSNARIVVPEFARRCS